MNPKDLENLIAFVEKQIKEADCLVQKHQSLLCQCDKEYDFPKPEWHMGRLHAYGQVLKYALSFGRKTVDGHKKEKP